MSESESESFVNEFTEYYANLADCDFNDAYRALSIRHRIAKSERAKRKRERDGNRNVPRPTAVQRRISTSLTVCSACSAAVHPYHKYCHDCGAQFTAR